MSPYLLLYLFLKSAASVTALSACYLPNGTALPLSAAYEPCIATENVFSMCCVLNATALVASGFNEDRVDTCLPNGICEAPASVGGFARDLCTDPTWKSPNCLNICVGGSDGGTAEDYSELTQCTDGSWCCGAKNITCCNNNQGFQVANAIPPYGAEEASATGTENGTSRNSPVKSTSNGAEMGLGAALGVILLAVVAVAVYLVFKRRGTQRIPVELGGDSKPACPMTPIQRGGSNATSSYGQEQSMYQSPQNHEFVPRGQGYWPEGVYAAEMDGAGKLARML